MKILEEFWYGNLHPGQRDMKADSPMGRASRRSVSCEEKLLPLLSEEAKVIFERLQANQRELLCASETEAFVLGYKLGARMAYEVMEGMDVPDIDDWQTRKRKRKSPGKTPDTLRPAAKMMLF